METNEILRFLREIAHYGNVITEQDRSRLYQAADRLEEMDEMGETCPYCTERMEGRNADES